MVTITFQPANKVVQAVVGQNLKDVAAAARIPIKYNCKKGYVCTLPRYLKHPNTPHQKACNSLSCTPPDHATIQGVRHLHSGIEREKDPHLHGHRPPWHAQERVHHQGAQVGNV